jgi:hypothetical protein
MSLLSSSSSSSSSFFRTTTTASTPRRKLSSLRENRETTTTTRPTLARQQQQTSTHHNNNNNNQESQQQKEDEDDKKIEFEKAGPQRVKLSINHNYAQHWRIITCYVRPYLQHRGWELMIPQEIDSRDWIAECSRMAEAAVEQNDILQNCFFVEHTESKARALLFICYQTEAAQDICRQLDRLIHNSLKKKNKSKKEKKNKKDNNHTTTTTDFSTTDTEDRNQSYALEIHLKGGSYDHPLPGVSLDGGAVSEMFEEHRLAQREAEYPTSARIGASRERDAQHRISDWTKGSSLLAVAVAVAGLVASFLVLLLVAVVAVVVVVAELVFPIAPVAVFVVPFANAKPGLVLVLLVLLVHHP